MMKGTSSRDSAVFRPRRSRRAQLLVAAVLALVCLALTAAAPAAAADPKWVTTWGAAPQGPYPAGNENSQPDLSTAFPDPLRGAENQSFRMIVRPTIGGSALRVRLSNLLGDRPVTFTATRVGLRDTGAAVVPGTSRPLLFAGRASVTVPAGGTALSDPLSFTVAPRRDLAVSFHVSGPSGPITYHAASFTSSYLTGPGAGDRTAEDSGAGYPHRTTSWFWINGIDVATTDDASAIVALGDSITDGFYHPIDSNARWTDVLAQRLLERSAGSPRAVVNEGISGNMILRRTCAKCGPAALDRLDRDVLGQSGASHVILFEGTNDIAAGATASQLIAGMREVADRVRAAGLDVIGATIIPREGGNGWSADKELIRQEVNRFVRTGGAFDAVLDFDAVIRDPSAPSRGNPAYMTRDNVHPNSAGFAAMGNSIDLNLFGAGSPPANTPPVAGASATPTSGPVPLDVQFTSESTDADGDQLTYDWDFGDGTAHSSEANPKHRYSDATRTFTARLTVSDGRGGSDQSEVVISPSPAPPPPTTSTVIEAENMDLPTTAYTIRVYSSPAASGGEAVEIRKNATISSSKFSGAAQRITVRAGGDICNGPPVMVVKVDGVQVMSVSVPAGWADYSAPLSLPSSAHTISVSYVNDYYGGTGCNRNLDVDKVTLFN